MPLLQEATCKKILIASSRQCLSAVQAVLRGHRSLGSSSDAGFVCSSYDSIWCVWNGGCSKLSQRIRKHYGHLTAYSTAPSCIKHGRAIDLGLIAKGKERAALPHRIWSPLQMLQHRLALLSIAPCGINSRVCLINTVTHSILFPLTQSLPLLCSAAATTCRVRANPEVFLSSPVVLSTATADIKRRQHRAQ